MSDYPPVLINLDCKRLEANDFALDIDAALGVKHDIIRIRIEATDNVRRLKPILANIEGIEINFQTFRDGRGYSLARIVRDELGFTGPLRAIGDVLRDQIFVMIRAGFTEFAVKDKDPEDAIAKGKNRFKSLYQIASDARIPAWHQRQSKT
jgi:uncharacterized protein (DUF934 family)